MPQITGLQGKFEGTKNVVYQEVLSTVHTTNNNPVVTILGGGMGIDFSLLNEKIINPKQHPQFNLKRLQ